MLDIIDEVDKNLICSELEGHLIRITSSGSNEIYIVSALECPNTMQEIGRLREITFRQAGGGTGNSVDIDEDDISDTGYKQVIVWNPIDREIVGGYRFAVVNPSQDVHFSMSRYFDFSQKFMTDLYPYVMELGRSFIQPKYQSRSGNTKSIFALDNLWDGLGAIVVKNPSVKYLIGKVTMYAHIDSELINLLYGLLLKYFPVEQGVVIPKPEYEYNFDKSKYIAIFDNMDYSQAMKYITKRAKELGENYPPLFSAYANLTHTMKVFGTINNPDFGSVLETAIMITIKDLKEDKYKRYISNFQTPQPQP